MAALVSLSRMDMYDYGGWGYTVFGSRPKYGRSSRVFRPRMGVWSLGIGACEYGRAAPACIRSHHRASEL